ncbi:hypothetical protein DVH24_021528 [Malus domestica]|uniref:Uncharacterized protein n=1 Tax=Malus domestica TaxID=3750 RepID=A0A498JX82_MALDO|nr:hypothetical protein DVH24_021528 [Malus domestica]
MRANTYKAQGQPSRRRCGILQSTPLRETDVLVGTPNGRESGSDTNNVTTPSSAEILSALWWNPAHRSDPTHGFLQNASLKSTCERIHIRPKDSPHVVDVGYYNQQCNHAFLRRDIVRFVVEPGAPVRPHSRICFCKPQLQNASLKSTCERIHIRPKDSPHVVDVGYYIVHMQKSDWKSLSLCRTFPSKKPYFTNLNPSPLF